MHSHYSQDIQQILNGIQETKYKISYSYFFLPLLTLVSIKTSLSLALTMLLLSKETLSILVQLFGKLFPTFLYLIDQFLKGTCMPDCYFQDWFIHSWLWLGTGRTVGTQDWSKRHFSIRHSSCYRFIEPSVLSGPFSLSLETFSLLIILTRCFTIHLSLQLSLLLTVFVDNLLLDLISSLCSLILIVFIFVYMASGLLISFVLSFLHLAPHLIIEMPVSLGLAWPL